MSDHTWRVSHDTFRQAKALLSTISETDPDTEECAVLMEDLQRLPNYPIFAKPDIDRVYIEEIKTPTVGVS